MLARLYKTVSALTHTELDTVVQGVTLSVDTVLVIVVLGLDLRLLVVPDTELVLGVTVTLSVVLDTILDTAVLGATVRLLEVELVTVVLGVAVLVTMRSLTTEVEVGTVVILGASLLLLLPLPPGPSVVGLVESRTSHFTAGTSLSTGVGIGSFVLVVLRVRGRTSCRLLGILLTHGSR